MFCFGLWHFLLFIALWFDLCITENIRKLRNIGQEKNLNWTNWLLFTSKRATLKSFTTCINFLKLRVKYDYFVHLNLLPYFCSFFSSLWLTSCFGCLDETVVKIKQLCLEQHKWNKNIEKNGIERQWRRLE